MAIPPKKTAKQANATAPVKDKMVVDEPLPKPAEPRTFWDRVLFFMQLRDVFWSVPLFFFLAFFSGWLINYFTDWTDDFYRLNFIQPLMIAGSVVVGAFGIGAFILYFYFRHVQRYVYGKLKDEEGIIKNLSKWDWNKSLTGAQRMAFALFIIFLPVVLVVVVYLKTVAKA